QVLVQQNKPDAADYRKRLERVDADSRRVEKLVEMIAKSNRAPELFHELGEIHLRNGKEGEAVRWFHGALRQDPKYRPPHLASAGCSDRHGRAYRAAAHRGRAPGRSSRGGAMPHGLRHMLAALPRHPVRLVACLGLLALLAAGGYWGVRHLRAEAAFRAAEQA